MKLGRVVYKGLMSIIFILAAIFVAFVAKFNQSGVSFEVLGYKVYTTSGFVLVLFSVLFYACFKGIFVSLRLKHIFEIRKLKYQYRQTIYKTKQQDIRVNLSKSLRDFGGKNFINTFLRDVKIEHLPYYRLYTKNMSSLRKLITAKKIYKGNESNSTATIIYAGALVGMSRYSAAKQILCDFVENKSLQIQNTRSMYIMCKIIVECESKISSNLSFVKKYADYIEDYDKNTR